MCRKKNRSHKVEVKGLSLEINTLVLSNAILRAVKVNFLFVFFAAKMSGFFVCFFAAKMSGCRNPLEKTFEQVWATQARDL